MTVRLWLMLADCWRCGASIELSEEQEQQIEQLLSNPVGQAVLPANPSLPCEPFLPPPILVQQPEPSLVPQQFAELGYAIAPGGSSLPAIGRRRSFLSDMPAWLVSMFVHLILFLLLALLTMQPRPKEAPFITLSAVLSKRVREGNDLLFMRPEDRAKFDLPLPRKANLQDERQRNILLAAANDAQELRLADDTPNLADLELVKNRVGRANGHQSALAARDPRLRVEMVRQEGGTTLTEAAVARGLKWLATHQNSDGSWSLAGFRHAANCKCAGDGAYRVKAPGTALALLPFLGAGQTHLAGRYKGTVSRGLRWLIEQQRDNGDLRFDATGNEGMYAHGQAAIALCEAFAMTGDELLRGPAQRAIDFIVDAQFRDGGWRYRPAPRTQQGDTSVVGWQLMALQSARAASLNVPAETWDKADGFLDDVAHRDGALYAYQTRGGPTATMTAEALLCRMYLGWNKDRPPLRRGVQWLHDSHFPAAAETNIYYWYYATQVMHHHGGAEWDEWNQRMRDLLVASQETQGHLAGSWKPKGEFAAAGGRIYMTSLAICTLEVYYRHLPIFRRIELE